MQSNIVDHMVTYWDNAPTLKMIKMQIHWHNEATRTIIKAINNGNHDSFLTVANVGSMALLADMELHHKCIPTGALPDSELNCSPHVETPCPTRNKMRSDMSRTTLVHNIGAHWQCTYLTAEDDADLPS